MDSVTHHVFLARSQVNDLRMGLNAEQNRRKNAKYPMQQGAGD